MNIECELDKTVEYIDYSLSWPLVLLIMHWLVTNYCLLNGLTFEKNGNFLINNNNGFEYR